MWERATIVASYRIPKHTVHVRVPDNERDRSGTGCRDHASTSLQIPQKANEESPPSNAPRRSLVTGEPRDGAARTPRGWSCRGKEGQAHATRLVRTHESQSTVHDIGVVVINYLDCELNSAHILTSLSLFHKYIINIQINVYQR
jgi:hypothetical protein